MPKNRRLEFPDLDKLGWDIDAFLKVLPDICGVTAINFFQDRFAQKGWIDGAGLEAWEKRKQPGNGSLLLKTSNLKDSFEYESSRKWVEVTNFAPYSSIHNEGGVLEIRITKKSRKFFWYMYHKTGDGKWKGMALTKKTSLKIFIPKRQFMGHSNLLMKRIDMSFRKRIDQLMKRHMK
jgi:phage gpG-like protein